MDSVLTKYRVFWICVALAIATAAVFYQACTYDFVVYDDPDYVCKNPNIQAGITLKAVKWAFTAGYASNWHPLTWLSHMLDWQLFGSNPAGHHLTNLIFHIANALALFYVLMRMTGAVWPSAFVAAAFALHPLHVESVVWVSERKDVLSTFFWLLTILAYVRYVENHSLWRYLTVLALFVLGLMAKPMLVTVPFVLLLLDFWPLQRKISYRPLVEKIPLFICSIASCIVTFLVQRRTGAMDVIKTFELMTRINNAVVSCITYITKMIWPSRLAVLYPHPGDGLSTTRVIICGLLLVLISIYFICMARRYRFFAVGWLWYLGTLVPVIGLVQVGTQAMADRYTYMTLTGLFIIIAWSAKEFVPKQRYRILALLAAAALIASGVTAARQLRCWKSSLTLFEHTLAVTENNYIIQSNYTAYLNELGRFDEAIELSRELLKIKPDSTVTRSNLGVALLCTGRVQEAIEHLRLAIKYDPNYQPAYFNLAAALQNQGRLDEAVSYYKQALKVEPGHVASRLNLAIVLNELGRFNEAVSECRKYLQIKPDDPNALNALGTALGRQGKFDEAASHFNRAIQIDPSYTAARDNLNLALAEKQKSQEKDKENTKK
jgi:tetratricopeptide (TPR) repeat protein